jgi:hypothetical protein
MGVRVARATRHPAALCDSMTPLTLPLCRPITQVVLRANVGMSLTEFHALLTAKAQEDLLPRLRAHPSEAPTAPGPTYAHKSLEQVRWRDL